MLQVLQAVSVKGEGAQNTTVCQNQRRPTGSRAWRSDGRLFGRFRPGHGNSAAPDAQMPFTTLWTAFAPRGRINATLSGFRPERGNLSTLAAIGRPRGVWIAPAPIMAIMSAADAAPSPHSSVIRMRPHSVKTHFFRNGKFTNRWGAPVTPVTRIQPSIKEKSLKTAFLQNH